MLSRIERLLPPTPLARRLAAQSALFATGRGAFLSGNAVFFTQVVGLSAAQVGMGLSASGLVAFAVSVPLGRVVDRVGPQRVWAGGAVVEAMLYLSYPFVHTFLQFVLVVSLLAAVGSAGQSGRSAYAIDVFPREERVRSQAYMRSALNLGFTFGTLISGLALASENLDIVRGVPVFTAVVLITNALLVRRLPHVPHAGQPDRASASKGNVAAPIRNPGFVSVALLRGVLATNQILIGTVIPLWLVETTDAPHWLLAWLIGTNTVMAILLQVRAARGADTLAGAVRVTHLCAGSYVAACLVVLWTGDTNGWTTMLLLWIAYVFITGAELFGAAADWGFRSELSDPLRRGEYQGVWQFGNQVCWIVGPGLLTWTVMNLHGVGWLLIAGAAIAAALLTVPAARAAQRYLDEVETEAPAKFEPAVD